MAHIHQIQNGEAMSLREQIELTAKLSAPAIIAQLSTILMQYIDASMVGRLGADASASVGLMNNCKASVEEVIFADLIYS